MLNPSPTADAIVTTLRTISALVAGLAGDASRIFAYHYQFGVENRLELAINKMPAPSIMVVFEMTLPGNFDGSTIWKHQFAVYVRTANAAIPGALSYEDLWTLMVNGHVNGGAQNIRYVNLLPSLEIMDTPGIMHMLDEDRMDMFVARFIIPEIGDN